MLILLVFSHLIEQGEGFLESWDSKFLFNERYLLFYSIPPFIRAVTKASIKLILIVANGTKYSRMDQVKFVEQTISLHCISLLLSRPYHFKFFKGCFPQISLVPFLNTLSMLLVWVRLENNNWKIKFSQQPS